ncbi:MAG: hypothetical protein IT374_17555 [Polyangiaceae bacterium]|nr:hypothetical protein [Polyangiaceae bacterium]
MLPAKSPLYTSKVGLWYTLWWHPGPGGHWDEWSRYTPTIGTYTSGGAATFQEEVAAFDAMRADFLLLDHTNGIGADGGGLALAGRSVVAALDAHPSLRQAVALGSCFWGPGVADRPACMATEANLIWSDHSNPAAHPSAFLRAGAPLLVNYTSPGPYEAWSDPRFTVGAATGRSSEASPGQLSLGLWGWVFDDPTPIHGAVMGVTPGWDTAHLGRPTTPLDREGGARFMRQWLRAISQNPESIIISSWNDFAEETAIQPATRTTASASKWADSWGNECPSFYYEIARAYSLMRWGLPHGAFVREEGATAVWEVLPSGLEHVNTMPTCHPVVVVPAGYLAQFPSTSTCAPDVGQACTIARPTDFGGFCWESGAFDGASLGYAGCACKQEGCKTNSAVCSCAGPVGRVRCDGACALPSLPTTFGDACWPDGSFSGDDMGFTGCACAAGSCQPGSSRCACTGLPGVPVCSGGC